MNRFNRSCHECIMFILILLEHPRNVLLEGCAGPLGTSIENGSRTIGDNFGCCQRDNLLEIGTIDNSFF